MVATTLSKGESMSPEYISIRQAADQAGFSEQWIRKLLASGRVKGFKLGGYAWAVNVRSLTTYGPKGRRKPGPRPRKPLDK